jgi:hypothetical protein
MGQPFDPDNRQYPPQQVQAPPAKPPRPRGPAILGLVAGIVVAVVVGGILAATGVLHVGAANDEPARVSAEAIALPGALPGFEDYLSVSAAVTKTSSASGSKTKDIMPSLRANDEKVSSLTRAAYQQANPGAAVAFEHYSDATIEHQFNVIAVRATYPGLTNGPVLDPAYLGLAIAPQHIQSIGDVQCLVSNEATRAGQQPDPKQMFTLACQRTGPALTVLVYGGNFSGTDGQQKIVGVTNATWTAVAG